MAKKFQKIPDDEDPLLHFAQSWDLDRLPQTQDRLLFMDYKKQEELGLELALAARSDRGRLPELLQGKPPIRYLNLRSCRQRIQRDVESYVRRRTGVGHDPIFETVLETHKVPDWRYWVTDEILGILTANMPHLKFINLSGHKVSNNILHFLQELPELQIVAGFTPQADLIPLKLARVRFLKEVPKEWEPESRDWRDSIADWWE